MTLNVNLLLYRLCCVYVKYGIVLLDDVKNFPKIG